MKNIKYLGLFFGVLLGLVIASCAKSDDDDGADGACATSLPCQVSTSLSV